MFSAHILSIKKKSPLLLPFTSISHCSAPFDGSRCQLAVEGNEVAEAPWWTRDWAVSDPLGESRILFNGHKASFASEAAVKTSLCL